jgi:hypothetical protein
VSGEPTVTYPLSSLLFEAWKELLSVSHDCGAVICKGEANVPMKMTVECNVLMNEGLPRVPIVTDLSVPAGSPVKISVEFPEIMRPVEEYPQ